MGVIHERRGSLGLRPEEDVTRSQIAVSGVCLNSIIFSVFAYPLLYILPAYIGNGAPILFGGGKPLDFKRKINNKRLFGDNKTIRGTLFIMVGALAVGLAEYPLFHYMLPVSVLLGIGTIVGDLIGSFIKRQMSLKPGRSLPVMDQYGFFIVAMLLALPLGHLPSIYGIAFLVVLTGLLHVLTNLGAHMLRLKSVPW